MPSNSLHAILVRLVFILVLFIAQSKVHCAVVANTRNLTIKDGDPSITYFPASIWRTSIPISLMDPNYAYGGSYHVSSDPEAIVQFSFHGEPS